MAATQAPIQRIGSGDMASALDAALTGDADEFLTRDEVTIDQIHSLTTGSSSKGLTPDLGLTGLSDFGSTGLLGGAPLMLNTELPSPSESTWLASPHSPGEADTTLPAYPSPDSRGPASARSHHGESPAATARSSASGKTLPRVAQMNGRPGSARDPPSKTSSLRSPSSRVAAGASSKTVSPGARPLSARTNSATSRVPPSPAGPGAGSARIHAASTVTLPTSPPGAARGAAGGRTPASPAVGRTASASGRSGIAAPPGGPPSRTSSYTAGGGSRIPRPGSAASSPTSKLAKPGAAPASPASVSNSRISSPTPAPAAANRPTYGKGPSGKYAGAASQAPARKALMDIMSEIEQVKQELGLQGGPSSGRSADSQTDQQPEAGAEAVVQAPVAEERVVFNISVAEPTAGAGSAPGSAPGSARAAAEEEQQPAAGVEVEQVLSEVAMAAEGDASPGPLGSGEGAAAEQGEEATATSTSSPREEALAAAAVEEEAAETKPAAGEEESASPTSQVSAAKEQPAPVVEEAPAAAVSEASKAPTPAAATPVPATPTTPAAQDQVAPKQCCGCVVM